MTNLTAVPRLTIGLPVYNGENFLVESLDTLLDQTFEDFELILSDNASTDGTADICHRYQRMDPRIRYVRQPANIGCAPNHNFVVREARGELFKWAAHDDRYGRELIERCVAALDEFPHVVLAHSWSAIIDSAGTISRLVDYPVNTAVPDPAERFRSMLFDGWGDDDGGVMRTEVLRRTPLHGSYHFADRTLITEIGLNGPFYQVEDRLYFRREHPGQAGMGSTVRSRSVTLDPRRADRLRHPIVRLYGEYLWGYISAIRRAQLSPAERRACYGHLVRWASTRIAPVADRSLARKPLEIAELAAADQAAADQAAADQVAADAAQPGGLRT
jgi:glycosyltransferase involved in cell wall biosynthesis